MAATLAGAQPGDADGEERAARYGSSAASFDDLVRATGLDAAALAARFGRQRGASSADAGFAPIFCPLHGRYEPRAAGSRLPRPMRGATVDPLFD